MKKLIVILLAPFALFVLKSFTAGGGIVSPLPPDLTPTVTPTATPEPTGWALASWYDKGICGLHKTIYGVNCRMANGELFDETRMYCACSKEIPLGTQFVLGFKEKIIVVTCTDRGNFKEKGMRFDLSKGAFEKLASINKGVLEVSWREND